jgi:predicted nicotinamide N-methyase
LAAEFPGNPLRAPTFTYRTKVEAIASLSLSVEQFESLDGTIDAYFDEYEKSGNAELFESLCPYFGVPWPAGLALAQFCLSHQEEWRGLSVLEIGCGLALPSLALAKAGFRVTASDFHPDVKAFLEANCQHNAVEVGYLPLDWKARSPGAQVIIGSDLVYDRTQPPALHAYLQNSDWQEAVIADPGRPYWEEFVALAKMSFAAEEFLLGEVFFLRLRPR